MNEDKTMQVLLANNQEITLLSKRLDSWTYHLPWSYRRF